jgi:hypothetical protein
MTYFWCTLGLLCLLLLLASLFLLFSKNWRYKAKWTALASAIGLIVSFCQLGEHAAIVNVCVTLLLLFLFFLVTSLVALTFQSTRPKAKWAAPACAIGLVISVGLFGWVSNEEKAREMGFSSAAARRAPDLAKAELLRLATEEQPAEERRAEKAREDAERRVGKLKTEERLAAEQQATEERLAEKAREDAERRVAKLKAEEERLAAEGRSRAKGCRAKGYGHCKRAAVLTGFAMRRRKGVTHRGGTMLASGRETCQE